MEHFENTTFCLAPWGQPYLASPKQYELGILSRNPPVICGKYDKHLMFLCILTTVQKLPLLPVLESGWIHTLFTTTPALEPGRPVVSCNGPALMPKCPVPGGPGLPQDRLEPPEVGAACGPGKGALPRPQAPLVPRSSPRWPSGSCGCPGPVQSLADPPASCLIPASRGVLPPWRSVAASGDRVKPPGWWDSLVCVFCRPLW